MLKQMGGNMKYPEDFINNIICGDCLTIMRQMPDECLDLVVTSPPYNLKNSTGNGMKDGRGSLWKKSSLRDGAYTTHDDNMPYPEYIKWQRNSLTEMMRLIKDDGAIFYNHKWRVQKGLMQDRREIIQGFPVRQIIIWNRKTRINFNQGYFAPQFEVIYVIAKRNFKLVKGATALGDVWEFLAEKNNPHPAPFPVALIERIISSTHAKTILDPFSGSGTTAIAALNLNRNYIGIDISPEYCESAKNRIMNSELTRIYD